MRPATRNPADRRAAIATAAAFAFAYAVYGLFRHWHFRSSAFDLGIFDQAVWHLSRFEAPASTISGFSNILGDHFYPVIALFVPLYWLSGGPAALIVAQAVLLAASIVPVFLYARVRLARGPAVTLAAAYGLSWGMQRTMAFDVHEMAFAPLAVATAIFAMDRRRRTLFWCAACSLVLIKEDLIPLLAGFGLYLAFLGERRKGVVLAAASVLVFLVVVLVVIPGFSDTGAYAHASSYRELLLRPWRLGPLLVTPPVKVETALLWFAPFVFVSLLSPVALLVTPLALERLLSASPTHWVSIYHYTAPIAPIVAMSAADGLARLNRRVAARRSPPVARRVVVGVAAASLVVSSLLPGRLPLWNLLSSDHYVKDAAIVAGPSVLAAIPRDASVVAQAAVVPHLSQRELIFVLDGKAPDADYVVAVEGPSPWPYRTFEELRALLDDRRRRGCETAIEQGGWVALRCR